MGASQKALHCRLCVLCATLSVCNPFPCIQQAETSQAGIPGHTDSRYLLPNQDYAAARCEAAGQA